MDADLTINEVIHAPVRLRICGMLRQVNAMDFTALKNHLNIQDSSLSKHLRTLTEAGYITIKKESSVSRLDARRITWVKLTKLGRESFDEYVRTLTAIVNTQS